MGLKVIRGGRDPNELDPEDPDDGDPSVDPSSRTRRKKSSNQTSLFIARLQARAEGLEGEALQAEIDAFIARVIEHHVTAVPEAFRDELRKTMRSVVETDPIVMDVVRELRRAKA